MASYLPQITDYIPQAQPFQPDYNFLGNMLQMKQSQYDSNYKSLSKTYGTLLNSPMLAEENILKREEYFKMIDNDIKRISGLDLSLQQNVDAANVVFDSFYQNKDMVHDMTYTKGYHKQLEIGEEYRNCIDQEKCGGKYWDPGVNALHYQADEYKKATKEQRMKMSPGKFTPFINLQEKAVKYLKDMGGTSGPFNIQNVTWTPDGKYIVTTKNGTALSEPFQQLLLNQYSQDQNIIDMFQTQAYVNRKSYVQTNTARFGNNEDAAEDEYFRLADMEVEKARIAREEYQKKLTKATAVTSVIEEKIKTEGTTGNDDLYNDFLTSAVDKVVATQTADNAKTTYEIAQSIFQSGDNRQMKRQRVDALMARGLMTQEISNAAGYAANVTGEVSIEADPYAKSYYDFSLEMAKMKKQNEYTKDEAYYKAMLDLSLQQAATDYKSVGDPNGNENVPSVVEDWLGASAAFSSESDRVANELTDFRKTYKNAEFLYVENLANTITLDMQKEGASTIAGREALHDLFGGAKVGDVIDIEIVDGFIPQLKKRKGLKGGYDIKSRKFYNDEGKEFDDVSSYVKDLKENGGIGTIYKNANSMGKGTYRSIYKNFYSDPDNISVKNTADLNIEQAKVTVGILHRNNLAVKNFAATSLNNEDRSDWNNIYFRPNGSIVPEDQFLSAYYKKHQSDTKTIKASVSGSGASSYGGQTVQKSREEVYAEGRSKYNQYEKLWKRTYDEGPSVNGKPLLENMYGSIDGQIGGEAAGNALKFEINPLHPNSLGTRGAIGFYDDYIRDSESKSGVGTHASDPGNSAWAQEAVEAYINDLKGGLLVTEEKGSVKSDLATVIYQDVAMSNEKYIGANYKFSPSWVAKKRKEGHTWATMINTEGVSLYTKKDKATNAFKTAVEQKPYDFMLRHKPVNISTPYGGEMTIGKMEENGSFLVNGYLNIYNTKGEKTGVKSYTKRYTNNPGGQNLYNSINIWLNEANNINKDFIQNNGNIYYNPADLPEVKNRLESMNDGTMPEVSKTDLFNQYLMENMMNGGM
jgi:hypothetical protein